MRGALTDRDAFGMVTVQFALRQVMATEMNVDVEALRRARGWSQAQLAKFLGIDQSTVSRIETGTMDPSGPVRRLIDMLASGSVESEAAE
jgi:putative transcriptional regulator